MASVPGNAQLTNQLGANNFTLVQKTSDEIRTSTTTLAADSTIKFTMAANTMYAFRATIYFTGDAAPDFKFGHTGPAGSSFIVIHHRFTVPGASTLVVGALNAYNTTGVAVAGTVGGNSCLYLDGSIQNGATGGDFQFLWAQNTSSANNSIVRAGSFIEYRTV